MQGYEPQSLMWAIVGVVAIFFLLRFAMLWYWRVNEVVDELKKANGYLAKIAGEQPKEPVKEPDTKN